MPSGNITQEDRTRRLFAIKECLEEGLTPAAAATKLGMTLPTIKRNIAYLEQLEKADLTPAVLAEKRSELYLELVEATEQARSLFLQYKNENAKPVQIKYMFNSWLDAIELRAKLYGLTNAKIDVNTQINTVNEYQSVDKLPADQADRLKRMIIESHEQRVRHDEI